jgi:hypothetical protein
MGLFNFKTDKQIDKSSEKLYASNRSFQLVGTKCAGGRYISSEELYNFIADYFSKSLENFDFKYLKSKKTFKRVTADGCDEISISFIDYTHYHVRFVFDKRIDALQKIITPIQFELGFNSVDNYKRCSTVSAAYGNMVGQMDIEIISYSVLENELPKVLTRIEKEVIPYFDKLNDINFVNQTLNYPEKDTKNPFSFFIQNGVGNSVITGLIITKALNDLNYDNLLGSYMTKFPQNIVLKENLIKLNEYLKREKREI